MTGRARNRHLTLGRDHVFLVPRDADWALAVWEATGEGMRRASQRLPNPNAPSRLVLRVYDSAPRPARQRARSEPVTYPVATWVGSQIVLLGRPGAPHQAVLGLLDEEGTFVAVCRSELMPELESPLVPDNGGTS